MSEHHTIATSAPLPIKARNRLKREATQAQIIQAFERLLQREGVRAVGVNSVVKEAGIGKGLLYKYFGGLPGLVEAWARQAQLVPDFKKFLDSSSFSHKPVEEQLILLVTHYANAIKQSAVMAEILADELFGPSDLSRAMSEMRTRFGQEIMTVLSENPIFGHPHNRALMVVLLSSVRYLALRARSSPHFMGIDLAADEGWEDVMSMIDIIVRATAVNLIREAKDVIPRPNPA